MCPRLHKYGYQEIPSGINCIKIPVYHDQGEISKFRSVTEPSEMFSHLIQRNSDHFSQAKSTTFVEGIFGQELPPFQQNDFSESILKGTTNLEYYDVNEAIKACISEMRYAEGENGENTIPSAITVAEFQQGYERHNVNTHIKFVDCNFFWIRAPYSIISASRTPNVLSARNEDEDLSLQTSDLVSVLKGNYSG